jgi:hypothetical protein
VGNGGFGEHRRIAVDTGELRRRPTFGQQARDIAGTAAKIDNAAGCRAVKPRQEIKRRPSPRVNEFQVLPGIPTHLPVTSRNPVANTRPDVPWRVVAGLM